MELRVQIITVLGLVTSTQSIAYNSSGQLVADLLTGYNVRQRPVLNQEETLSVYVSFRLSSIRELDEVTGKFSVMGALVMTWRDELIKWTPAQYDNATVIDLKLSDIWYPKMILSNPYSKLDDLGEDWMMIFVQYNGMVYFTPGSVFESTCSIDVTYYPFDTQECYLQFLAWGYHGNEVGLYNADDEVKMADFMENGEWEFASSRVDRHGGDSLTQDRLRYTFRIKRRSLYLVINVVAPILILGFINILVFVLPAESGERLSFSVTVLLALAVYMTMVGENLPKTSDPMSVLSFYLLTIMLLSTLITVATIFNLEIYHRNCDVTGRYKYFARKILCFGRNSEGKKSPSKVGIMKEKYTKDITTSNDSEKGDNDLSISWREVCIAIDRGCMVVFCLTSIIINITFLSFLACN